MWTKTKIKAYMNSNIVMPIWLYFMIIFLNGIIAAIVSIRFDVWLTKIGM